MSRFFNLTGFVVVLLAPLLAGADGAEDRAYSVQVLTRIAQPVLAAAAAGQLKTSLPAPAWEGDRGIFAPLEAVGRTISGIAPWLELGPDTTTEGQLRAQFTDLALKAIANGTDPKSPDFLNFTNGNQPLVDAAFLAQGLLRAPTQLWGRLPPAVRSNVIAALKATRGIQPGQNNWLLFSATIEAALWEFTGEYQFSRIDQAVRKHQQWYVGDGTYGDGAQFHWDYYNSYVIQPMLVQVLGICAAKKNPLGKFYPQTLLRAQRYAAVQERMISPEATYPVIGRSSTYRFGAFQHLANQALLHQLPAELKPGAVRAALTAVIRRVIEAPGTFDTNGWLQVGAVGNQPSIRESYISTGSPYLCLTGLVHLGLPANDPFWTDPAELWTQARIWSGEDIPADHALP